MMMTGMIRVTADLEKLRVREECLREADDDDVRAFITHELIRLESQIDRQRYVEERRPI